MIYITHNLEWEVYRDKWRVSIILEIIFNIRETSNNIRTSTVQEISIVYRLKSFRI